MTTASVATRRCVRLVLVVSLACWGAVSCGTSAAGGPLDVGHGRMFLCRPVYGPDQRAAAPEGMIGRHVTMGVEFLRNTGSAAAQMLTARLAPGSKGLQLGSVLLGPEKGSGVGEWPGAYPPTSDPEWSDIDYDWGWLKPLGQSTIPGHVRMQLVYELTLPPGVTLGDSKGLVFTYKVGRHRYKATTTFEVQIPQWPTKCTSDGTSPS